jgi:hypothetical protein
MGRWMDGQWQMKQAIDRQIVVVGAGARSQQGEREGSRGSWRRSGYSHQQTRFSASTIADNDELSAEFCHFGGCGLWDEGLAVVVEDCRLVRSRRKAMGEVKDGREEEERA